MTQLTAIDLYAGVGGWSLGLKMAGIDVVASYEWWTAASDTNARNNRHPTHCQNIRELVLTSLPSPVDLVVGSPPCTQFSFSNRGGSGDIADGLKDIEQFLEIVDYLKPRAWVMENVPRTAKILQTAFEEGGVFFRFRHLKPTTLLVNMEDYGLPQRRKRCLIGNMDFSLLTKYAGQRPSLTLGSVLNALKDAVVTDPIYGVQIERRALTDHEPEEVLNFEEQRINRAAKCHHTIYNSMEFPDRIDRSVRTITATCTRVSRESIIIEDQEKPGTFRRLTVRERACLQGFPLNFQFYGNSYAQKVRMVGNAFPPAFSFYVAHALQGTAPSQVPELSNVARSFRPSSELPKVTPPERPGRQFPEERSFRFAVPSLQLKSGVRFELFNSFVDSRPTWATQFVFGSSNDIRRLQFAQSMETEIIERLPNKAQVAARLEVRSLEKTLSLSSGKDLQARWNHSTAVGLAPLDVLDLLDEAGVRLSVAFNAFALQESENAVRAVLLYTGNTDAPGVGKLLRNAAKIHAGLILCSCVTRLLAETQSGSMEATEAIPSLLSRHPAPA